MTDKEMLELAAKAVGYKWREDVAEYRKEHDLIGLWIDGVGSNWNPLEKCDNAFRLAVMLGLSVEPYPIYQAEKHHVIVKQRRQSDMMREANPTEVLEPYGDDRFAATRRAITRVAAEIGKTMEQKT